MDSLNDLCHAAIERLEHAVNQPPLKLTEEVDVAERAAVRVRDELIRQLRAEPDAPSAPRLRAGLLHTNTALSLIVGVEYPVEGIKREPLKQARSQLELALDAVS